SQPAATSSWQSPEQLPVHSKFGALPVHSRVPIAWQSAATSAETSHEPMHWASIEPGSAVTSHSAAAWTATSTDAWHFGGSYLIVSPPWIVVWHLASMRPTIAALRSLTLMSA